MFKWLAPALGTNSKRVEHVILKVVNDSLTIM